MLQQPIIHSRCSERLLKEKLRLVESQRVNKAHLGQSTTYVFALKHHKRDPRIPILSDEFLANFIERRSNGFKVPRQKEQQPKKPKQHQQQTRQPQQLPTSKPQSQLPKQSKQPPQPKQAKELREQKHPQQQHQPQPQQQQQQQPVPPPPPPPPLEPKPGPAPERDQQATPPQNRTREVTPIIFAKGSIDELVIREQCDDEFASCFVDDDEEEETLMSRNLKKIRSVPPPSQPQPQKSNNLHPNAQTNNPTQQAEPNASKHQQQTQTQTHNQTQPQIRPQAQLHESVAVKEHQWTDTEAKLNQDDLDNTYGDLFKHRDKIQNSDLAKKLLKELAIKCFLRDETKWFLDTLKLMFEFPEICEVGTDFRHELVSRLKSKLNPVATYKSTTNREYIRAIYEEARCMTAKHFYDNNLVLSLPFPVAAFLAASINRTMEEASKPPVPPKVEKKENSDPATVLGARRCLIPDKVRFFRGGRHPVINVKVELKPSTETLAQPQQLQQKQQQQQG